MKLAPVKPLVKANVVVPTSRKVETPAAVVKPKPAVVKESAPLSNPIIVPKQAPVPKAAEEKKQKKYAPGANVSTAELVKKQQKERDYQTYLAQKQERTLKKAGLGGVVDGAVGGVGNTLGAAVGGVGQTVGNTTKALGKGDVLGGVGGLTGGLGKTVGGVGRGLVCVLSSFLCCSALLLVWIAPPLLVVVPGWRVLLSFPFSGLRLIRDVLRSATRGSGSGCRRRADVACLTGRYRWRDSWWCG